MSGGPGPVEAATREQLEEWQATGTTLGQSAIVLARTLDEGAGLAVAAVARELRATIEALVEKAEAERAGDDAIEALIAGLSAPLRDSQD